MYVHVCLCMYVHIVSVCMLFSLIQHVTTQARRASGRMKEVMAWQAAIFAVTAR